MKIELIGGASKEDLETRIRNVAAAGKLSRFPGNVYEVIESCDDYEKNLKMIERIIKMGHKSIIEHDYLVFALCDVTPIIEQTIIGNRLTSFTIKSRREVDFRNVGFYTPEFRDKNYKLHKDNEKLQEKYNKHMKYLFNKYADLVDNGIKVEDARFILPYSYYSNIIMGLDARELEKLIIYLVKGKVSHIKECRELGLKLYNICKKSVPYLIETMGDIEDASDKPTCNKIINYISSTAKNIPQIKILEKPKMVSNTPNPDEVIIQSAIMYNYQCSKEEANAIIEEAEKQDANFKQNIMNIILKQNEQRELEQVSFTFQIPISLSILTHLTRHRMHSLLVPDFVPMWNLNNYIIPAAMKSLCEDEIKEIFNKNIEMYNEFKELEIADEDLVYFYLGGNMCNVLTTMNARTLQWIARLRCCNKAQWQIRSIFQNIVPQVKEVAPLLGQKLGATCDTERKCYEGKECCGKIDALLEADKRNENKND